MKSLIFEYVNNRYPYHSLSKEVVDFHQLYQHNNQCDEDFLKELKAAYEGVHQNGGLLGGHPALVMWSFHDIKQLFAAYDQSIWMPDLSEIDYGGGRSTSRVPAFPNFMGIKMTTEGVTAKDMKKTVDNTEEGFLAMCLLRQANCERHGHILAHLKN